MDVTRAITARRLAGDLSEMAALAAALADEAVWDLTRAAPAADVAKALGVSVAAVRKAVQVHNRRRNGLTGRTDSDMAKAAKGTHAA